MIGCSGSGKSTLSRKLQDITGLPLVHLDKVWWKADGTHISREEFDARLAEILRGEEWIIDGDYSRTYGVRFEACDTVIFLDYSLEECLKGIDERVGKERPDMPWTEKAPDPELRRHVLDFETETRPRVLSLIEKYPGKTLIFRTRAEADAWLDSLREAETVKKEDAAGPDIRIEEITRRAAVLIPVVREKEGPALLMEVRALNIWQPGEICFPGGHIEAGESSVDTALRETYEELGIPASSVRVLEEMEPELHMAKMLVYPVLAEIDPFEPESLTLLAEEVGEVFTLPFDWLLAHEPAIYGISDPDSEALPAILRGYLNNYTRRGTRKTTLYWEYGKYGIWGLTARLLNRFRERLLHPEDPVRKP